MKIIVIAAAATRVKLWKCRTDVWFCEENSVRLRVRRAM